MLQGDFFLDAVLWVVYRKGTAAQTDSKLIDRRPHEVTTSQARYDTSVMSAPLYNFC